MSEAASPGTLSPGARRERFWTLYDMDRVEQASEEARAGVRDHPEDDSLLALVALSEFVLKRTDSARAATEATLARNPESHWGRRVLVRLRALDEEWEAAEDLCRQMVAQHPDASWSHLELAQTMTAAPGSMARVDEIESHLSRAIELDPEDGDTYVAGVAMMLTHLRYRRAEELALAGLAVDPANTELQAYATALMDKDDHSALRTHGASLVDDPTSSAREALVVRVWNAVLQNARTALALNFLVIAVTLLWHGETLPLGIGLGLAVGCVAGILALWVKLMQVVPRGLVRQFVRTSWRIPVGLTIVGLGVLTVSTAAVLPLLDGSDLAQDEWRAAVHTAAALTICLGERTVRAAALRLSTRTLTGGVSEHTIAVGARMIFREMGVRFGLMLALGVVGMWLSNGDSRAFGPPVATIGVAMFAGMWVLPRVALRDKLFGSVYFVGATILVLALALSVGLTIEDVAAVLP